MLCLVAELKSFKCRSWIASFLITILKCVQLLNHNGIDMNILLTSNTACSVLEWLFLKYYAEREPKLFIELLKCLVFLTITRYYRLFTVVNFGLIQGLIIHFMICSYIPPPSVCLLTVLFDGTWTMAYKRS